MTTSQAARLLSVSPDTVLKWVRAGKVKSYRTLGGHFRIPISALDGLRSTEAVVVDSIGSDVNSATHLYCWEFLGGGEVRPECEECITYRSRAARCYQLKDLPGGIGCLNLMCDTECSECDYYRLVNGQAVNVLVLSESSKLLRELHDIEENFGYQIRFADTEYEAALTIQEFRPDYIVIDCALGRKRTSRLCSSLFNDVRLPVTRIILASRTPTVSDYCEREAFGWIRKPFTFRRLRDCIEGVPEPETGE